MTICITNSVSHLNLKHRFFFICFCFCFPFHVVLSFQIFFTDLFTVFKLAFEVKSAWNYWHLWYFSVDYNIFIQEKTLSTGEELRSYSATWWILYFNHFCLEYVNVSLKYPHRCFLPFFRVLFFENIFTQPNLSVSFKFCQIRMLQKSQPFSISLHSRKIKLI